MSESRMAHEQNVEGLAMTAENGSASAVAFDAPRCVNKLLDAVRPFAEESRLKSWWCLSSTLAILGILLALAAILPWWPLRLGASVLGGLVLVRTFILYHDFMHGAILRGSWLAKALLGFLGLVMLTPPRYWRHSHNFHHAHVGKPHRPEGHSTRLLMSDVGSFPLMTTRAWQGASFWERLQYRLKRHPLTMLSAYVTVFLLSLCFVPLLRNPRKYWDGSLALLVHGGLVALLWVFGGWPVAFFAFMLPFLIAGALGAYLFYVQHNFERNRILPLEQWSFQEAALDSSSYLKLGPIMRWFTGNIGYHHIHHLNSHIPFYRLPEVMAAVPELQHPPDSTLRPRDVWRCLRLNLWDPERQQLVTFRDAKTTLACHGMSG